MSLILATQPRRRLRLRRLRHRRSHNQGIFTIQTAIEQVKSGGRVCIGPGVYVLTETITLSGAQSVELAGHGSPVLLAPTAAAQVDAAGG